MCCNRSRARPWCRASGAAADRTTASSGAAASTSLCRSPSRSSGRATSTNPRVLDPAASSAIPLPVKKNGTPSAARYTDTDPWSPTATSATTAATCQSEYGSTLSSPLARASASRPSKW
ncbi:hypothetical protein ACFQV2_32745 [Actinokineospora soli]|uniref:Uncharacterized protein n=1 Tax=Actinokineospora soli TaxID=1048753 RepID=A0ABW2TUS8_9PSEU